MGDVLRERITKVRKALAEGGLSHPANKLRAFALLFSGVQTVEQMTETQWDELFGFLSDVYKQTDAKGLANYIQDSLGTTKDDANDVAHADLKARSMSLWQQYREEVEAKYGNQVSVEIEAETTKEEPRQQQQPPQQQQQQRAFQDSQSDEQRENYAAMLKERAAKREAEEAAKKARALKEEEERQAEKERARLRAIERDKQIAEANRVKLEAEAAKKAAEAKAQAEKEAADAAALAAKQAQQVRESLATDTIVNAIEASTGVPFPSSLSPLEREMLTFEKRKLLHLSDKDLAALAVRVRSLKNVIPGRDIKRVYAEYAGTSQYVKDVTTRIYFQYPLDKFSEMAQLFHRHGRDLTVRPKPEAGPNTLAGRGLAPDLGGAVGILTINPPDGSTLENRNILVHIEKVLDLEVTDMTWPMEINNTRAVMSLLLLHGYTQEKPLGPAWDSPEAKAEMYKKYGLSHLLEASAQ